MSARALAFAALALAMALALDVAIVLALGWRLRRRLAREKFEAFGAPAPVDEPAVLSKE